MSARADKTISVMRTSSQIPLRFLHTLGANFTLPIQKKPIETTLLPFSLKKTSGKAGKLGGGHPQHH
jgi:hypothetical protein